MHQKGPVSHLRSKSTLDVHNRREISKIRQKFEYVVVGLEYLRKLEHPTHVSYPTDLDHGQYHGQGDDR